MIRQAEEDIISMIQSRRKKQKWPLKMHRARQFATNPELNRLRLLSSIFLKHKQKHGNAKDTGLLNKNEVKSCALCSSANAFHMTVYHCSLCAVPLCRKKMVGFDLSCHDAWHSADDLGDERRRRKEATMRLRNAIRRNAIRRRLLMLRRLMLSTRMERSRAN